MSVTGSIIAGWRRAFGAPWLVAGVVLATAFLSLPLTSAIGGRMPDAVVLGMTAPPMAGASAGMFLPDRLFAPESFTPFVLRAIGGYLIVWVFLAGGMLDRLARGRRIGTSAFFAACGVHGVRFLRLAVPLAALSWIAVGRVRSEISATPYGRVGTVAALAVTGLIVDFALVRAVVEDRHSMLGAVAASWRFVRRRLARSLSLYLLNVVLALGIVTAWRWVDAPTSEWPSLAMSGGFLLLQTFARLAFMASETVFFQGELAHAHYTAAPLPTWPDSPAEEAIRNLARQKE